MEPNKKYTDNNRKEDAEEQMEAIVGFIAIVVIFILAHIFESI